MADNAKPCLLYDNRFLDAAPVATDTETGYDVANITDLRPFTWFQFDAAGTKYITVDCGSAKSADALAIIGHNLYTAGATISVESSPGAEVWSERLAGFTVNDNKALLKKFATVSARHWRLKIVTATVAARLAVVVLGARLDFERYPSGNYNPASEKVNGTAARSKAGHMIGATLQNVGIEIRAEFKQLTDNWVESTFRPAWDAHLSQLKPFFWAWDTVNHAADVRFVSIPEGFSLDVPFDPYRRSLSLTMEGIKE